MDLNNIKKDLLPSEYSGLDFDDKFNNNGLLPNYSKDSELALQTKIKDLEKVKGAPESLQTSAKLIGNAPVMKSNPALGPGNVTGANPNLMLKSSQTPVQNPVQNPVQTPAPSPANIVPTSMKCKFLSSSQCHPDYPNFSGASIELSEGSNMKCDNMGDVSPSKAVCTISNGKINGVYIIHPGAGYKIAPKVEIVGGGGKDAILKPILVDGKIKEIKILNEGNGFYETPILKIDSPNSSNGCFLCCK